MANLTTSPGVLILDTAATIRATGTKVKISAIIFTGTVLSLQNGAGTEMIRLAGSASCYFGNAPLIFDGLIVAAGVPGTATLILG